MSKLKRGTPGERRRPLAEINLAESRPKRAAGRRGCLGWFGALVVVSSLACAGLLLH